MYKIIKIFLINANTYAENCIITLRVDEKDNKSIL